MTTIHSIILVSLIAYEFTGLVLTLWMIGQERKPITPGSAIVTLFLTIAVVVALLYLALP